MLKKSEPTWQSALNLVLTVIALIIAVPAVLDGDWQVAVIAFVTVVVVEVAVLAVVRRVQRRR